MIWQDFIIMAANFGFATILIPQALDMYHGKIPMNRVTCVATFLLLIVMGITLATIGLWLSMCAEFANAFIWGILSYLSMRNGRDDVRQRT